MFKKTRRKIVAAIMSILVLIWVGTLAVIYSSSYLEMSKENRRMLKIHSDSYSLPQSSGIVPHEKPIHGGDKYSLDPSFADTPIFKLSTFYTVAVTYDGKIIETKNEPSTLRTDEELETLALKIIQGTKTQGREKNLAFYKTDKGGYMLVAFMDNTVLNENAATLFRYTLIFGGIAIVIFFFFSVLIAGKIVKPLEESYKMQKQFISDAGHELKTPVSIVSANAELLSREVGDNKWLNNIQYENERMGMLVGQFLELARTENISPKMQKVDFSRLTAGETLPFESIAFERGLMLKSDITENITVEGNDEQLKQLVSVLLDNAVRHSSGGNEVEINLSKEHGFAKLSVINSGEEIPKEQRQHLFDRFYRTDDARNGDDKHYGLGLAIAKAIVSSHKGKIEVKCYDGLVEFCAVIPL